jgi:hypothetical protein
MPEPLKYPHPMMDRRGRHPYACNDCGVNTSFRGDGINEYYMVEEILWELFVPEFHGNLCIGCFEGRLGRQLTPQDFIAAPIHMELEKFPMSDRLRDRLGDTSWMFAELTDRGREIVLLESPKYWRDAE